MDTSFTHSFDWLHKLIYLYNISTLPSKQVTRTKMTNQILKWMTIALQQMKKHLFADTDVQTGKKNVTKKIPETPISICPRNKKSIYYGKKYTQFTKGCSFFLDSLNSPRYK